MNESGTIHIVRSRRFLEVLSPPFPIYAALSILEMTHLPLHTYIRIILMEQLCYGHPPIIHFFLKQGGAKEKGRGRGHIVHICFNSN